MFRKTNKWSLFAFVVGVGTLTAITVSGQSHPPRPTTASETEFSPTGEYSRLGADSCILCHNDGAEPDASAIFATPHASRSNPDAPFSGRQCESCHGPGKDHARAQRGGGSVSPPMTFGINAETSAADQNQVCMACHQTHGRLGWYGSTHEEEEVPCAACHQIHRETDPVFDPLAQQQTCFGCHQKRRADIQRSSNHPLRFGSMTCSDCHDPHAGANDFLLQETTINETCFTCHADKRGPFLWEHAPASEDCTLCHRSHGSNHDAMLTKRTPLLCQQCHSPIGHPSVAYTPGLAESDLDNRFMLGRACLNCHSAPHGSNHPSGVTLDR